MSARRREAMRMAYAHTAVADAILLGPDGDEAAALMRADPSVDIDTLIQLQVSNFSQRYFLRPMPFYIRRTHFCTTNLVIW